MSNALSKAGIEIIKQPFGYSIRIQNGDVFDYYDFKEDILKKELKGKLTEKKIKEHAEKLMKNKLYSTQNRSFIIRKLKEDKNGRKILSG